jgi:hypothetical protein
MMSTDATPEKSSATKLFCGEEPDRSWPLERLGQRARELHQGILVSEQATAPAYWELGRVLELARKQLGRGVWGRQLAAWGINKVRASRARAIFRRFSTPGALSGRGVEEAYAERYRRQVHARRRTCDQEADEQPPKHHVGDDADQLATFLEDVRSKADRLIDVAGFMEHDRRTALFSSYQAALERFRFLGRILGVEDASPSITENSGVAATATGHLEEPPGPLARGP